MEFEAQFPKATWAAGAAQNTSIDADVVLSDALRGIGGDPIRGTVGGNGRNQIRSITIVAQDNHIYDLHFFSNKIRYNANSDLNKFLGRWQFAAADGVQNGSDPNNFFYYYIDGLNIPVRDDDNTGQLHISLIDRSVGGLPASHNITVSIRFAPLSQFP